MTFFGKAVALGVRSCHVAVVATSMPVMALSRLLTLILTKDLPLILLCLQISFLAFAQLNLLRWIASRWVNVWATHVLHWIHHATRWKIVYRHVMTHVYRPNVRMPSRCKTRMTSIQNSVLIARKLPASVSLRRPWPLHFPSLLWMNTLARLAHSAALALNYSTHCSNWQIVVLCGIGRILI